MLDAELVRRKLRLILEDLERLRPLANKTLDAYLADPIDRADRMSLHYRKRDGVAEAEVLVGVARDDRGA